MLQRFLAKMNSCVICCDSESYSDWQTLPCGHSFHSMCLSSWLWKNQSCPVCRTSKENYEMDNEFTSDLEMLDMIHEGIEARATRLKNIQKAIKRANKAPANSSIVKQVSTYLKWKDELKSSLTEQKSATDDYSALQKEFEQSEHEIINDALQKHRHREIEFFDGTKSMRERILISNKRVTRAYRNKKLSGHRLSTLGSSLEDSL